MVRSALTVNQQFIESIGYSTQEIVNSNIKQLIVQSSMEKEHCRRMFEAIQLGKHWHGALHLMTKNGQEVWFRTIIQPNKRADKPEVELSAYSAELTNTISQSREKQDMLTALNRSLAIIEFSLDGIILDANENFLRGTGYSKAHIVGSHHKIFCDSQEVNSQEYADFWNRLGQGEFSSGRFKRFDRAGNVI